MEITNIPSPDSNHVVRIESVPTAREFSVTINNKGIDEVSREVFQKYSDQYVKVIFADFQVSYYDINEFREIQNLFNSSINNQAQAPSSEENLFAFKDVLEDFQGILKEAKDKNIHRSWVDVREKMDDFFEQLGTFGETESTPKEFVDVVDKLKSVRDQIYVEIDARLKEINDKFLKETYLANEKEIKQFEAFRPGLEKIYKEITDSLPSSEKIAGYEIVLKNVDWIPYQLEPFLKDIIDLRNLIRNRLFEINPPKRRIPPPINIE